MEFNLILKDIQSNINDNDVNSLLDNLEKLEDKLRNLKSISKDAAEKITNLILKLFLSNNKELNSQGLLFLNTYQKHLLHLKNINESEFENVIKVHINKLLYPLIKQLKESGQTGILSNDSLIDMYSLILKFHLQENKDLMTQFKNDILKGFVIDSNNEKEKDNTNKSMINSKNIIPLSSIFAIPGTIPSYPTPKKIELFSISDIDNEISTFCKSFIGKETEENWDMRNKSIQRFRGILYKDNKILNNNIKLLKPAIDNILISVQSLRTALCITSCLSIIDLANVFKAQLDVYSDIIISKLMPLINQTNKVISTISSHTIACIIKNVSYNLRNLQILSTPIAEKHKNTNTRQISILLIGISIEIAVQNDIQKAKFEKFGGLDLVISCLKKSIQDAGQFIRETSRKIFSLINIHWKPRANKFMDSLDSVTKKNLIKYLEKNPGIPSSSNKIQALKKKNKSISILKKRKILERDNIKSWNNKQNNKNLSSDSQVIDFNFNNLTLEQQKHSKTTPSKTKKEKPIIGLKRSYSSMSDKKEIDNENNIIINTPSKSPRPKASSERKRSLFKEEMIQQKHENNNYDYDPENTPSKSAKKLKLFENINQENHLNQDDNNISESPSKKKIIDLSNSNMINKNEDDISSAFNNDLNKLYNDDKVKNKFTTPKKIKKPKIISSDSKNRKDIIDSSQVQETTPTKNNKLKKIESSTNYLIEVKNENSKIIVPKSSSKKKKHNGITPNSPSLSTPYLFKQSLIKKFKEVDNPKIRIEALKELIDYFKASKVNKLGTSLQINESIMSFLNDTSDDILKEILNEETLDILLKTRVISIEQLIPKIIEIELKIKKQNDENIKLSNKENIYSEFSINKVNNIVNWIKQEKFTVPIMKNIIIELIAKNGKSRKKYNNVNEILECLLEWIIELLINDMSENIFYMNAKSNKESMILLLGNWISTTFGNEINGRSLISFLWCIKKLNNKTLKYIREYFSEEIYNQLIKGIEILDNEFEKSKETILYDNYEEEIENEDKENHQNQGNTIDNEVIKSSKENLSKNLEISISNNNVVIEENNKVVKNYKDVKDQNKTKIENGKRDKNDNKDKNDGKLFKINTTINNNNNNISNSNNSNNNNNNDNNNNNNQISLKNKNFNDEEIKIHDSDVIIDDSSKTIKTTVVETKAIKTAITNLNDKNITKNEEKIINSNNNEGNINKKDNIPLNKVKKINEKSGNTLIKNLMEIDEQYSMLPEETSISNLQSSNKYLINEKSFVTHRNVKLSDIIESDNSLPSFSHDDLSSSKKRKIDKIDENDNDNDNNGNNNNNTNIDMQKTDNIKKVQKQQQQQELQQILQQEKQQRKQQKQRQKQQQEIIYIKENDELSENKLSKKPNILRLNTSHQDKRMKKEYLNLKLNRADSKTEMNNSTLNVKKIKIEPSLMNKVKEEPKDILYNTENGTIKKEKLSSDRSVILIENSEMLFEKENARRKLESKPKKYESIIILDDPQPNLKQNKAIKENDIIVIDSSYSKNEILNINNKDNGIEEKNKSNVKNLNKLNIDTEVIQIDDDTDQSTPKNNFETNLNENITQNKFNKDNHNSNNDTDTNTDTDKDKDNTMTMEISQHENELSMNNPDLDENKLLLADNINKIERRTSNITLKASKNHYINLDFINDNYCKYKKPLGIERLFIKETPNAKYFSANIDQDILFSNLYENLKSSKPNESVFRNLIRLSNIENDKNITNEKLMKVNELWNSWFERIYLILIQKLQTFNNNLYITTENTLKIYAQNLDKISCLKTILSYLNRQFNFNIDSNSIYEQNLKFSYRSTSESFAFEILSQIISRFSQNELQEYIDDIQQVLSKGLSCTLTDIRRTVIDCCFCINKILNNEIWTTFLNKFTIVNQILIKMFIDQFQKKN
ncbi:clasp N terminal-domain-containing protein [Neocallimastix sp. 'constans']